MPDPGRPYSRKLLLAGAGLGLIAAAWIAGATGALHAAPAPTVVVVADFKRVYEGLKETADRADRLEKLKQTFQEDLNAVSKRLEAIQLDIDNAKPGSKERRELVISRNQEDVIARAKKEGYTTRLTLLAGDNTRDLYQKFGGTLEYLSKQQGWDVVLLDDRLIPIPEQAANEQVTGTISTKGILYVGPKADVTDLVITQMNNDYAVNPPIDRTPVTISPVTAPPAKQ